MKNLVFVKKAQRNIRILAMVLLICFLTVVFSGCAKIPSSYEEDKVILSEMSEKECLRFIASKGVVIHEEFRDKPELGSFVKELIALIEKYPEYPASYSYTVLHNFAQQIKKAVNDYYGIIG